MKIIVLYIVLFTSSIIAQNLNEDFKYLAEYAIIKHKLEFYNPPNDWGYFPYPEDTTNSFGPFNKTTNFKFNIKEIFKINDIRIIEIEDLTDIGPYPHFKYIFAVKPFGGQKHNIFQKEFTFGKEESFIDLILGEDTNVDKLFFIKLYNLLTDYYKDVEYF